MQTLREERSRDHVYAPADIARAAGVSVREVERRLRADRVQTIDGRVAEADAVRLVKACAANAVERAMASNERAPLLFSENRQRRTTMSLATSGALHAALACLLLIVTWLGSVDASAPEEQDATPARLVFLMTPGPGGGGGGSGMKMPLPPRRAQRKAAIKHAASSPVPEVRKEVPPPQPAPPQPPPPQPVVTPTPAPTPAPDPPPAPPAVKAPVAPQPADQKDETGVVSPARPSASQGPGTGGNAGAGTGRGVGEGEGSGIGAGSGGGTGGGPYRPGAGIDPPRLLQEVKANYTEEARRQGIQGDVTLEIVVQRDGSVGSVRVLHGLEAGLDRRAVEAVRQWRFTPARRYGTPVDVIAEVSVRFKLR